MPLIFVSMVSRRMFPINILNLFEFSIMSDKIDEPMIWHQRYGHLYSNTTKLLDTNNMVEGLPSISFENQVYARCIFGNNIGYH